ncbi:glycine-rich domain-containing protein [Mycobacterium intracellulare]|uniref:Glycine-rich domain-containing protein n=1 Tax=Mycobacterium intracellulare TaxID=1767 RepID=A0AAE4R8A0_MYCIT|nr:hypothetical protein [Mycobacterium intracellulare]MDV6975347.1 hypothetical protein [Mycobacterium intracellulare]MDV6980411.1 hypothetical protein [Mycobacterium intracellulare]MDV7010840.1 hypothetical protein [Mycobacterium intracellulare]MDV7025746.1 hypothetical protein [Mycobacterium intracellulare]
MTTPNQSADLTFGNAPDLSGLVGVGAFQMGGGSTNYGQNVTDAFVQTLIHGPAVVLAQGFTSIEHFMGELANYLKTLPIEALRLFQAFIPGAVSSAFNTVASAVETIINALSIQNLKMMVSDFENWLASVFNILRAEVSQIFDAIAGAIVTPITSRVQQFIDWLAGIGNQFALLGNTVNGVMDNLWGGLMRALGIGKSPADVGNAAGQTADQLNAALSITELNNAILAIRNNKSIFSGIDETSESNFLIDSMFTGGADPKAIIPATAASVPVAYWRAAEVAKKGTISWFGKGVVGELRIDLYKANYETRTWDLVHTSPNLSLLTDATWQYNVYSIEAELDRIDVEASDVIGCAWRVVGSGTHNLGGVNAGAWMGDHPFAVPARPASTRTGVGPLAFDSTTYSNGIPWFGIGIIDGDVAPPVWAPQTRTFAGVPGGTGAATNYLGGSGLYIVPDLVRPGDIFDIVLVGDGGGGNYHLNGSGGGAGEWKAVRLIYGVDIPLTTKQFQILVGPGGDGGSLANDLGDWGLGSSVVIPGWGTIAAKGGGRSASGAYNGASPGDFEWQGKPYKGGGVTSAPPQNGVAPGGGGHNAGPVYQKGGTGAPGCVWVTVSQGDPSVVDLTPPAAPTLEIEAARYNELHLKAGNE